LGLFFAEFGNNLWLYGENDFFSFSGGNKFFFSGGNKYIFFSKKAFSREEGGELAYF